MGVNSLPKTAARQPGDCDLNPGPTAPESSTLTARLPSLLCGMCQKVCPGYYRIYDVAKVLQTAVTQTLDTRLVTL